MPALPSSRMPAALAALLLVLIGIAAFIGARYRHDIAAAHARLEQRSALAHTPCGTIEYAVAGKGPPVLLVHGAGGGFDQGLSLGAPLVQAGFTVIAPSRFGYLRTPAPADASPAAQADAHACLLDALGIDRVVAFGASAGAPSAAELCIRHAARCRAMVLVVPALFAPTGEDPEPPPRVQRIIQGALSSEFMFWLASEVTPRLLIATVLGTPPEDLRAATPADQAQVLRTLRNVAPIGPRAAGLQLDGTVTTAPAAHDFARIDVPSLLVSTDDDGYNTLPAARHAAARIPHAQLVAFAGGGHLLVGHQDELWSAILRFLARIPDPQQPD